MLNSNFWISLAFSLLLLATAGVQAQEEKAKSWTGLKQMMSQGQFNAAGLDRLSDEELRQLDRWILNFLAHESEQVLKTDKKIKKLQESGVKRRIKGTFKGWWGKTVFRLDNGEVWQQRHNAKYSITLESPEVEIKKNLFGFYEMSIIETGRRVGVTRLK